jgi:hypothetical protein
MKNLAVLIITIMLSLGSMKSWAEIDDAEYFSEAELEQILAPIALYPDSVLTHIFIAATYPLEVVQAHRWLETNSSLNTTQAIEQTENKDWDPSVKALIPFPRVLERLSKELDWMQSIGDAFIQDEERVLSSIQSLRRKADQAGSLSKMENTKIVREERQIIIQPVEVETIYVPYYDTRVVYGNWYWRSHPPVYWDWHWGHNHRYSHSSYFYWHPRVYLSHSHHYHYSAFNWHNHHVVILDHRRYNKRRYHRTHIIRHENAQRWQHNPKHRRGVAYRTEVTRKRYESSRPSRLTTKQVRKEEHQIRNQRRDVTQSRTNTKVTANRGEPKLTRQQRIKDKMSEQSRENTKSFRERKPQERLNEKLKRDTWNNRTEQTKRSQSRQVEPRQIKQRERQDIIDQETHSKRSHTESRELPVERKATRTKNNNYKERNTRSEKNNERASRSEARSSQRSTRSNSRSERSQSRERRQSNHNML